jgi:hypothetical protein
MQPGDMSERDHIDSGALLIREITRYLAAVDVFRAELCEPTWLAEARCPASLKRIRFRGHRIRSTH